MSETSSDDDDFSALISYTRSGETGQSAGSISDQGYNYDFLDFLGVAQSLKIHFLPITWQPGLDEVGEGGTAKIRQALIDIRMTFAFKHLKHPLHGEQESRNLRALIAEISILGHPAIRPHPNIITIEGICWDVINGDEKVWPVLVFEKTPCGDLNVFMTSGPGKELNFQDRLDILFQVALAIKDLHAIGAIHGDIKPENILISPDGDGRHIAKVIDFGYSTLFSSDEDPVVMPYSGVWTAPEYHHRGISPEQARKMDVYSFGMLCSWLLFHNINSNRDRSIKRFRENSSTESSAYASEMLKESPHLEHWEIVNMERLFRSTLAEDPADRTACFIEVLEIISPQRTLSLTPLTDHISIPHTDFQITLSLPQLVKAHYGLRCYIVKCLKERENRGLISRYHALNLAFCYELGIGTSRDVLQCRSLLSKHNVLTSDLEDIIKQLKRFEQPLSREQDSSRPDWKHQVLLEFTYSQRYREEQLSREAESQYRREVETMGIVLGEGHALVQDLRFQLSDLVSSEGRWKDAEKLQVQILEVGEDMVKSIPDLILYLRCVAKLSETYACQNRQKEAEELQLTLAKCFGFLLGAKHEETIRDLYSLIGSNGSLDQWSEIEQIASRRAQERKKKYGEEHPFTSKSVANLANAYLNQGRWKEAEELQMQAFHARNKVLGTENPDTLSMMTSLVSTHRNQKLWERAEELGLKALQMTKRILGTEHPATPTSMHALATVHSERKRWKEAEELLLSAVETRKTVIGVEHPDTLSSMSELALILSRQEGRQKDAEDLYVHVIETSKRVTGPEHPSTLTFTSDLASMCSLQGRFGEALEIQLYNMETSKRVYGAEHPDTLDRMRLLAQMYWMQACVQTEGLKRQERLDTANHLQVQVLETRKRLFGSEHLSTLDDMSVLLEMYWNQGQSETEDWLKKTEDLEVQIIEANKKIFGPEHERTLNVMRNIANTYWDQGMSESEVWKIQERWRKDAELKEKLLEVRERVNGAEDPELLTEKNDLAVTYRSLAMCETDELQMQSELKKAEDLHVYVMGLRMKVLGREHSDVFRSMIDMALTYKMQGRCEEAEEVLHSASDMVLRFREQGRWKEAEEFETEIMSTREWDHERTIDDS